LEENPDPTAALVHALSGSSPQKPMSGTVTPSLILPRTDSKIVGHSAGTRDDLQDRLKVALLSEHLAGRLDILEGGFEHSRHDPLVFLHRTNALGGHEDHPQLARSGLGRGGMEVSHDRPQAAVPDLRSDRQFVTSLTHESRDAPLVRGQFSHLRGRNESQPRRVLARGRRGRPQAGDHHPGNKPLGHGAQYRHRESPARRRHAGCGTSLPDV